MKKLLLTDVDGTLTKKSLVLSHAHYLIKKGIITDDGSCEAWLQDVKNERLIIAVAENYRHKIVGKTEKDLQVKDFFYSFVENNENWYTTFGEILNKGEEWDIVFISGSSDFLVKELCNYCKDKNKKASFHYYASEYLKESEKFTGEIIGMFAEPQKEKCVKKNINIDNYNYIEAWGDTSSDNGLFIYADYKILVEPTQETLENLITRQTIDKIL